MRIIEELEAYIPFNEQEEADRLLMLEYIGNNRNILSRECMYMHFTASAWIVNEAMTRGLFVYHNIYDSWSWTGGHADGEENLLSVALREAREETGIGDVKPYSDDIFSIEIIAVDGHEKKDRYVPSHLHLNVTYLLTADESEALSVCEEENSRVGWMNLDEIVRLSSEKWMVDKIYLKLNEKLRELKK